MSKKRNENESTCCLTPKSSQNIFVYLIKSREKNFGRKRVFYRKGEVED